MNTISKRWAWRMAALAAATLAATVVVGSWLGTTAGASEGPSSVHLCAVTQTGVPRIVAGADSCRSNETHVALVSAAASADLQDRIRALETGHAAMQEANAQLVGRIDELESANEQLAAQVARTNEQLAAVAGDTNEQLAALAARTNEQLAAVAGDANEQLAALAARTNEQLAAVAGDANEQLAAHAAEQETTNQQLASQAAALEDKLAGVTREVVDGRDTLRLTGMNLQVVDGSADTAGAPNGLGNVIIGYNEQRAPSTATRTGSHYLIVGEQHEWTAFGGIVAGLRNTVTGERATVSGGEGNRAHGLGSAILGGSLQVVNDAHACHPRC